MNWANLWIYLNIVWNELKGVFCLDENVNCLALSMSGPLYPPHLLYPLYHPFTHPQCCNQHFPLPLCLAGSLHPSYTHYRKHLMPRVPLFTHRLFFMILPVFGSIKSVQGFTFKLANDEMCGWFIVVRLLHQEIGFELWINRTSGSFMCSIDLHRGRFATVHVKH